MKVRHICSQLLHFANAGGVCVPGFNGKEWWEHLIDGIENKKINRKV
ncbi:MAG: hypothetical protein GTO45_23615 [Candidatus Aminicenantes bacterium]|nr:hypothetical protein [Candidatus Aminicenantes bacterium]NIN21118.1 hypothetical protein [Candidatus Aminicenantes bacterium]NIN44940.1 hypothetical protein [Candidatus Aminicenantes bacterium]NIN87754.1 hypothetical protein [Candidatus Aminicenantes bacterium]NIO84039.1 hypothetical protein [Candidatus Aminicenantes bacterium]